MSLFVSYLLALLLFADFAIDYLNILHFQSLLKIYIFTFHSFVRQLLIFINYIVSYYVYDLNTDLIFVYFCLASRSLCHLKCKSRPLSKVVFCLPRVTCYFLLLLLQRFLYIYIF